MAEGKGKVHGEPPADGPPWSTGADSGTARYLQEFLEDEWTVWPNPDGRTTSPWGEPLAGVSGSYLFRRAALREAPGYGPITYDTADRNPWEVAAYAVLDLRRMKAALASEEKVADPARRAVPWRLALVPPLVIALLLALRQWCKLAQS